MSVEGDASTYATTASCQASPFVTFFGIQEDGLETYRHDGNTTVDSAAINTSLPILRDSNFLDTTTVDTAAVRAAGPAVHWERPGTACAVLGASVGLYIVTCVLGYSLVGVLFDLLLAVSAAASLLQLFSAAPQRAGAGCLSGLRESIRALFGYDRPPSARRTRRRSSSDIRSIPAMKLKSVQRGGGGGHA